eukprot:TRINITY_DN7625_c0_g1_i1.p1 TRINITY_DN7625_c0_g1~~TRINITY_DN7625_c0_g1_i1.p1  ORF type:complete len:659 (+),score=141.91 TRINITY_DN7625_c0_g1_i1:438-2414(+)
MAGVERFIFQVEDAASFDDGRPSIGPVYRSVFARDGFAEAKEINTCWDIFNLAVQRRPENPMLGRREIVDGKAGKYTWITYKEAYDLTLKIGSAIRSCGVGSGGRCGIYGANCPEWIISMEACNGHGVYCVPLYDTLGVDAVEFIISHAEVSIAFVQETKISLLLKCLPRCVSHLKTIVSFGEVTDAQKEAAKVHGVEFYSWKEFLSRGEEKSFDLSPPRKNDVCTIMYTSGTTGEPKGVLITNENIVTLVAGIDHLLASVNEELTVSDVYFSFLPLAHIFDRVIEEFFISKSASIGFWRGDAKLLVEDIAELKPTIFCGVPRVFDRIYSGMTSKVAAGGFISRKVFDFAYNYKLSNMRKGLSHDNAAPLFDKIVFSKVKQALGGRVRLLLSGAAPLSKHVEEYLRVVTCAHVLQGYGLTETCAGSFVSLPNNFSMLGTVGPPLPNIDARLESVPEMGYDALSDVPRGEICIRGKPLFLGYHKREDLTKEVMIDGWFHTGDIGEWQKDGALKVIDRKKNIFKLSQGEYVAVENLENVYGSCPAIDSIWVYGNSFESFLVAVVTPNEQALENWAKDNGVAGSFNELCQNPIAKKFILDELNAVAKSSKLKGFEFLKAVHLDPVPFDMERDLLTPTFKKKRPQLLKYYKDIIDELYKSAK